MLEWIISSSVLIAVVICLRFILKGKISLRLQYMLWALVLVRLLLPFSIGSSNISIMNQVEHLPAYQEIVVPEDHASGTGLLVDPAVPNNQTPPIVIPNNGPSEGNIGGNSGVNIGENTAEIERPEQNTPNTPETPPAQELPSTPITERFHLASLLRAVWLGGGVILGAWFVATNLLFAQKLRKNRTAMQTASPLPVYLCDKVDTPCLFGLFRPAIYLTSDVASDARTMRHAVEHEMTHYRHKDHIWAILRCVCLAVHWYNPLVWCAAILSRNDAELSCDDSTIRRLGESERAEYGRTLLRLTCEKRTAILTTATTMTGSGRSIKERIALIVKQPKMAVYTLIAVLVIAAAAVACTFTGADDNDNEKNAQLWPEDTVISCARFEYAGDNGGYKLITSEVAQFDSLRHMNLIPAEGEFTGDVIYRLILNWNEIAKGSEEYTILVSETCLSVNGQLYLSNGFDFSEILSYFEGKYQYFTDYPFHDAELDSGENSSDTDFSDQKQPTDEEIRAGAIVKNFASLQAEDIKLVPDYIGTDYSAIAVLLNDLAQYRIEPFEYEAALWSMTLYLSGSSDVLSHEDEDWLTIYAYSEESLLRFEYHSKFGTYTYIYFDYPALYQYIRKNYNTDDVIDTDSLARYRDIIEARAEHTIEVRNSNFDTKFSGFEIVAFHQIGTFERDGMAYTIYEWDVGFITDKNNINYPWVMNRVWVDADLRIRSYDSCPYFVVRTNGEKEEYTFFPWDTPLYGTDYELELGYDEIAANFSPETGPDKELEIAPGITLSENLASLPDAVTLYAVDYVQTIVKYYNDLGAYSSDNLYHIVEARITNIEQIPTGAVGLTDGLNLYRLSYRLLADQPENIMLAGGMTMDGEWLTEWGSTGQPFLLLRYEEIEGETVWTRICVTNTDVIMVDYGTPEMLAQYEDPFLAASIELYHKYLQEKENRVTTLPVLTLSDMENDAVCAAAMHDLKTGWWNGLPLADCIYEAGAFECVYREDNSFTKRFYGYAGYFRFDENGNCVEYWYAPSIVTLDALSTQIRDIWWPGDGAYYERDILDKFPDEIAKFVAEPNEERYQVIRDRLLEIARARMVPVTPTDTETRLSTLVPEDIKYIDARSAPSAAEITETLRAALSNRIEHAELEIAATSWDFTFFLSGDDSGYSYQGDEWVWLRAGLEENIVEIRHHKSHSDAVTLFVEDEVLYQLIRGTYYTEPVIDKEAFARYGDILEDRAQKTVDQSRVNLADTPMLPYTGYEITELVKVDEFTQKGDRYEVYEWDVAFLHDDPTKVVWAGGMWLDSQLRVRSVEETPYFVVCISGDTVAHDFFFWDLYSGSDEESGKFHALTTITKAFGSSLDMQTTCANLTHEWQRRSDLYEEPLSFLRVDENRERELTVEGNMLSVLSSAANNLQQIGRPDNFRALGGGIYVWFDSTRHLAFFAGEEPYTVLIRYVADDANETAVVNDPQLYLYIVASAEQENVQLADLDDDGFLEAILWLHSENNLIIYDYYENEIYRIDTNQAIGCTASNYTGLIANIQPAFNNMVQAQSEDGTVSIYRYKDGAFTYECPISEVLR